MKTWGLVAMMADGTSFATEAEFYELVNGELHVRTVGLEDRTVEGECLGVIAIPRTGIRTVEELANRTIEELPT